MGFKFIPGIKWLLGTDRVPPSPPVNVGVVILSHFPIPEHTPVRDDKGGRHRLQLELKNAAFLERVLAEVMAKTVLSFCSDYTARLLGAVNLFLVYRQTYTSAFHILDWFSILPNHELARPSIDPVCFVRLLAEYTAL